MWSFVKEMVAYARTHRKLILLPLIFILLLFGGLLLFAHGSVLAPFIYTIF